MYFKKIIIIFFCLFPVSLVANTALETGTKYTFNEEDYYKNIEQYTLSNGEDDSFACRISGILFAKEALNAHRDNTSQGIESETSPTVINLYKDKIEWIDLDEVTMIIDGSTNFIEGINLEVILENDVLFFGYKYKEFHCKIPFSKV